MVSNDQRPKALDFYLKKNNLLLFDLLNAPSITGNVLGDENVKIVKRNKVYTL